jgi:hypothetical protein
VFTAALIISALVASRPAVDTTPPLDTVPISVVDTNPRPRPIEYSDWYARRLLIHRIGSYTMLPLFGTEYVLGQKLINGADPHSATGRGHLLVASGIAVLFTVNTGTGLWNLWDARSDPSGRTRRTIHSLTMLASDAGFLWTGAIAGKAKHSTDAANHHRNVALGSIGLSTVGTVMRWFWKN